MSSLTLRHTYYDDVKCEEIIYCGFAMMGPMNSSVSKWYSEMMHPCMKVMTDNQSSLSDYQLCIYFGRISCEGNTAFFSGLVLGHATFNRRVGLHHSDVGIEVVKGFSIIACFSCIISKDYTCKTSAKKDSDLL